MQLNLANFSIYLLLIFFSGEDHWYLAWVRTWPWEKGRGFFYFIFCFHHLLSLSVHLNFFSPIISFQINVWTRVSMLVTMLRSLNWDCYALSSLCLEDLIWEDGLGAKIRYQREILSQSSLLYSGCARYWLSWWGALGYSDVCGHWCPSEPNPHFRGSYYINTLASFP